MWFSYIYYFFCARPFDEDLGYSLIWFFLHVHNHLIKNCGPLPFIITFVHDHLTKIRGHSYSLIYSLMNCVYNSCATFIAVLIYFVHYIQGRTALIFRTLCPRPYEVLALNMPCFLLAWKYLSQVNKLPSLSYQRRGADSKIDSKFSTSSHRRSSVKKGVLKFHTCVKVSNKVGGLKIDSNTGVFL